MSKVEIPSSLENSTAPMGRYPSLKGVGKGGTADPYLPACLSPPFSSEYPKSPQSTAAKHYLTRFPPSSSSLDCNGSNENARNNILKAYGIFLTISGDVHTKTTENYFSYSISKSQQSIRKFKGKFGLIGGREVTEKP